MPTARHVSPDDIRKGFSKAMSDMYRDEVPLYGALMELVAETNARVLNTDAGLAHQLQRTGEIQRLDMERHGAIRLGTAEELATISRLFAVMGMQPVGYYDLTPAGVPVHSTAFRAVHESALQTSPFRVFTSLLRLELIENPELRAFAESALAKRSIFTPRALELIQQAEVDGGLDATHAEAFIQQALETFRWHHTATVTAAQYQQLSDQHRLIADVVAFKGPHINHLTPRTLDIDQVQAAMPGKGITPKAVIEGPPRRQCPILLRQTSFKALDEAIAFTDAKGSHSARFGEIEQRGVALTPKGRALYDQLLNAARDELGAFPNEANAGRYTELMEQHFQAFPDNHREMREQELAYFRYFVTEKGLAAQDKVKTLDELIAAGHVDVEPLVYEDFLPVSAAGIFQSNLGDAAQSHYAANSNQAEFEKALGRQTIDELKLYGETQQRSIDECTRALLA
ncbi:VOC family protein [Pseudomonas sp. CBSPBW29]|uniref:2-oxoadipate dioxygenase/decarboxylase HglS n=1 Tax=Pseudomonas TaxID=286 RepID=UPI0021AC471A|nr:MULTISPECIES: VOC family protein [unclassified Pseudomonas]WEL42909.1 VOC family protein [Pseudomonas sp. CBSPBW29]WEL63977.1 VOC family protein [Pseudomonas sp. CBSPGW29]WEL73166.1 VOC family protein [Pseudomonas sp. CBSPCGW29]WEL74476.1 VOC family protein [Pseudomonas sp. CBSPAW29]WEL81285.1 VOC family protein [Pseudomonas sp. CBSPCAW29]WEL89783.1 VOC family protein [Pseudomonas sp. CBSPCBW29]